MALALVILAALALLMRNWIMRRLSAALPPGRTFDGFALGRARPVVEAALWTLLIVLTVLPILALLGTALVPALGVPLTVGTATFGNLSDALANATIRRAFGNSFGLSVGAALLAVIFAGVLAFLARVMKDRSARWLDFAADAPFVVPGTVLALAMILTYLRPLPLIGVSIYGTIAILFLAYFGRFLALVLRPVSAAMETMDPALDEAARIAGVSAPLRMARIAAPAAVSGALLIFLTAFNELTVSALLWSSGTETVGVMIFAMQYEGNSTGAAALSVISLTLVFSLAIATDLILGERVPSGTFPWRSA